MAVMNYAANAAHHTEKLAQNDVLAVRNAFLKYSLDEQARLLCVMPVSDTVAMLNECSLRHIQLLLERLEQMQQSARKNQLAAGLGLVTPKGKEPGSRKLHGRAGWLLGAVLLGVAAGVISTHAQELIIQLDAGVSLISAL